MDEPGLSQEEKIWLTWFLITAGSFAIIETHAIKNRKTHGTLTYSIRRACGLHPVKPWRSVGAAAIVSSSAWFAVHIITGKLVPKAWNTIQEVKNDSSEHPSRD